MLMHESLKSGVSTPPDTRIPTRSYSIDQKHLCGDASDTFDLGSDASHMTTAQGQRGGDVLR